MNDIELQQAAKAYQEKDHGMWTGKGMAKELQKAFMVGAEWAENNRTESKMMCLRDKTKICNLCHDCDVYVLNPYY